MASPHIETSRRTIPPPVLRVRSQLCDIAVRIVRDLCRVGALARSRWTTSSGHAAFEGGDSCPAGAEMSTDVSVLNHYLFFSLFSHSVSSFDS